MAQTRSALLLTATELARCQRVGARLAAELGAMISRLPVGVRSVRETSNRLKIDRSVYQRILAASRERSDGCQALLRAPGTRGLQQFIAAFERTGGDKSVAVAAKSVVVAVDDLTRELGGSQTQLHSRIQASVALTDGEGQDELALRVRRKRYELDVQLFGVEVESRIALEVFRPLPGDPTKFEFAHVIGSVGVTTHQEGTPFILINRASLSPSLLARASALDGSPLAENESSAILEEFSTMPLPQTTSRGTDQLSVLVVDAELRIGAPPFEVFASRLISPAGEHPAHGQDNTIDMGVSLRYPTRNLLFDTYLHRSMARACTASTALYCQSDSREPFRERWYDRLQNPPHLEVRGPARFEETHPSYPRMAELAGHVFDLLGWDATEFVNHRCHVEYPLSGAQYVTSFDFAKSDAS